MTTHVMLDLETWGLKPGCDIRSVGAVVFDPIAGHVAIPDGDNAELQFYIATNNPEITDEHILAAGEYNLDTESGRYCKYPLKRDAGTVKYWNDQSAEAQAAFANPVDLRDACIKFALWLESVNGEEPRTGEYPDYISPHVKVWSNGPHFDIVILAAVYEAVGLPVPWHYRAPRDMRTITDAAGMSREEFCNYGVAHNSLDDSVAQAMTVCEAYKRLGLQR